MYVILDGCPKEYEDLFRNFFESTDLEIIRVEGAGNHATFGLQVKFLCDQNYSKYVFFAEDDYYYLPDKFEEMIDFIRNCPNVHFVTPYDHLDYYTMDLHSNKYQIAFHGKRHWRTAASTCLTFLTTREILRETKHEIMSYQRGNLDVSMWMSLTKYEVLNPLRMIKYLRKNPVFAYYIAMAWRYCGFQIVFKKRWNLWAPLPSLATHMESRFLAPTMGKGTLFQHDD
jgi:hypothetical protein